MGEDWIQQLSYCVSGVIWVQGKYNALAQEHPEYTYLRDICVMFKHLR